MNPLHPFANGRPAAPQASPATRPSHQTNDTSFPKGAAPLPSSAEPAAADQIGRDTGGRFTKGNKGSPGNPYARKTAALRQALLDTVTAEDLQAIVRQLIQQAKEGDVSAARLVFSYTIGKPDKAVDLDTLDQQEWQQIQQSRVPSDDFLGVVGGLQAPLACAILRAVLPIMQNQAAQDLHQKMSQPVPDPEPEADQLDDESDPSEVADLPGDAEPVPSGPETTATPGSKAKQQRAPRRPAAGSAKRPLAGCDDHEFLAQEQASWIAFLKDVMDGKCLDPEASPPGPGDP